MRTKRSHLCDEEILLFIDRELPTRRRLLARDHLAECQACGSRRAELEGTLAEFSSLHEETIGSQDSSSFRLRSLLRARIAESVSQSKRGWPSRLFVDVMSRQLVGAGIALMIVGAGYWAVHEGALKHMRRNSIEYQALALPRRTLTPGAIRAVGFDELCSSRDVDNDPPVNATLQEAVFKEYGLPNSSQNAYALDYLITPALGGSDDIKNLWPQPYSSTWNARVKDQLEDHLHELVCEHKVQLATAQDEIASDWISAYKRYFDTDKPRPSPTTLAAADPGEGARRWTGLAVIGGMARGVSVWRLPIYPAAPRLIQ